MGGRLNTKRSGLVLGLALGAVLWAGATVQGADRSVTVIEGVDEPPPAAAAPDPAPLPPQSAAEPLLPLRTENPAGLALVIRPDGILPVGTKIAFEVSTHRTGYLVVVDINAEGRWSQIYPNPLSLSRAAGNVETANLVKPGASVTIPNPVNPLARFVFTADPPVGSGAIVAILSDRPVQIIDLPESPTTSLGLQASLDALSKAIGGLKIASSAKGGSFSPGNWSFAAASYVIR